MGSLLYVAPEVLTGADQSATPALDIWSIGCIIYALLTGGLPFEGSDAREITRKIVKCKYKRLTEFPNISRPWKKLINSMLQKDPLKRCSMLEACQHLNYYRIHPNSPCESPTRGEDEEPPVREPVQRRVSIRAPTKPDEELKRPLKKAASFKEEQKKEERLALLNGDKPQPNYMKPTNTRSREQGKKATQDSSSAGLKKKTVS